MNKVKKSFSGLLGDFFFAMQVIGNKQFFKVDLILDQLVIVYYLYQVITQSDLGENQLYIQSLDKLTEYNFLSLTPRSFKVLVKFFISEYNS